MSLPDLPLNRRRFLTTAALAAGAAALPGFVFASQAAAAVPPWRPATPPDRHLDRHLERLLGRRLHHRRQHQPAGRRRQHPRPHRRHAGLLRPHLRPARPLARQRHQPLRRPRLRGPPTRSRGGSPSSVCRSKDRSPPYGSGQRRTCRRSTATTSAPTRHPPRPLSLQPDRRDRERRQPEGRGGQVPFGSAPPRPSAGPAYFLLRVKFLMTVDFFLIVTVATVGWKPSLAAMTVSGLLRTSSQRAYPPAASVVSV